MRRFGIISATGIVHTIIQFLKLHVWKKDLTALLVIKQCSNTARFDKAIW